jgi:hypothetical protein
MKKFLFALLHSTRVIRVVSWVNRKHVPILCYHSVIDSAHNITSDPHKQHIPLPLFLRHLDYLQKHHHLLPLSEFQRARRENRALPDNAVVLTFDDGFRDFATVVAPHLTRRKIPATVFIITERALWKPARERRVFSYLGRNSRISRRRFGHWLAHLRTSAPPGSFASGCDARTIRITGSGDECILSKAEVALSYPFGQTSEQISGMANSAGYSCAIASGLWAPTRRV